MKNYKPNVIPLKTRATLGISSMLLLTFILAELATGYTYLPGKRGGILLSGIPSLMISFSASALCIAALLTIIDHYDKRQNEYSYTTCKMICYKIALFFFIAAPIFELSESILIFCGIDIFPKFHGLADKYTLYTPALKKYTYLLSPILNNNLAIIGVAFLAGLAGHSIEKFAEGTMERLKITMFLICIFCVSLALLSHTVYEFLTGATQIGRGAYKQLVSAETEPAKFNAILLTQFFLSSTLFTGTLFGFFSVLTRRIKP